jgi:hypothetical protein
MNTATILLNIDLAAGTAALVAIAMVALPNIDRIRAFRRQLTRRPVLHTREQRLVADGLSRSRHIPRPHGQESSTLAQRAPPPSAGGGAACVHDSIRPAAYRNSKADPLHGWSQAPKR